MADLNEYFNDENEKLTVNNCQIIVDSSEQISTKPLNFPEISADAAAVKLEKIRNYQKKYKEKKCNDQLKLINGINDMELKNKVIEKKIIKLKEVIEEFKIYANENNLNKAQMVSTEERIINDDVLIDEIVHDLPDWTNAFPNYYFN